MSKPEVTRDPPNYPGCKHPNVNVTRGTCLYCGKQLTQEEIRERVGPHPDQEPPKKEGLRGRFRRGA